MTQTARDVKWYVKHAAILGAVLGIVCQFLPERYQVLCRDIAHLCTLGG